MRLARVLCIASVAVLISGIAWAQLDIEGPQDSLEGAPTINHCTLRKAVINANLNGTLSPYPQCRAGLPGLDTITFDGPFTITLTLTGAGEDAGLTGDLDITEDLIIDGALPSGRTIIDGNNSDRVFHIHPGATVTIRNMWIRNGSGNDGGGGILVDGGTLNLENVTISGCHAPNEDGGAIKVQDNGTHTGVLNMRNCTISGNSTNFHAGAIVINGGLSSATIVNSTITGNTGGFPNTSGGIRNTGTCTLRNTIVAGNSGVDVPNLDGAFTSLGYNIIGELGTISPGNPQITATTGDQFDVALTDIHLGPLQDNGGPAPTHALLTGSIALDQGHSSSFTTDERGSTRPCDDATLANATGGDGADVGAYEEQVTCSNTPPDAVDDSATINEDSGANTISVLGNDSDANGDTLTITAVTQGAHGSVVNNGTSVSYSPASNFFGTDSFTYTISDGHATDTATVSMTVNNVNDPPVATGESYSMNQDTVLTIAAPGVLANDTDIDGDTLHAVVPAGNGAHGTAALNANGGFTYTPNAHFAGTDTFTYQANDTHVNSNTATVTIHIADTEAPAITAGVTTSALWSPNHDLVNVGFNFSAADNSTASTTSVAVYSDEDDVTPGGGDMSPDAANIGSGTLRLRAERSGGGDGRVYLLIITALDAFLNASHRCLAVTVPKSQSAADVASVNAQAAAAVAQCTATGHAPAGFFVVGDGPVVGPKQ